LCKCTVDPICSSTTDECSGNTAVSCAQDAQGCYYESLTTNCTTARSGGETCWGLQPELAAAVRHDQYPRADVRSAGDVGDLQDLHRPHAVLQRRGVRRVSARNDAMQHDGARAVGGLCSVVPKWRLGQRGPRMRSLPGHPGKWWRHGGGPL
jgi:hypothetical protein